MAGPYLVRKPAPLVTQAPGVTGDGKGSENPVMVGGANQVVLLIDANKGSTTHNLDVYMEISINGTDYYRETSASVTAGVATMTKRLYRTAAATFAVGDDRIAIAIDVLSSFARFNFAVSGGATTYDNVACRAITGRV